MLRKGDFNLSRIGYLYLVGPLNILVKCEDWKGVSEAGYTRFTRQVESMCDAQMDIISGTRNMCAMSESSSCCSWNSWFSAFCEQQRVGLQGFLQFSGDSCLPRSLVVGSRKVKR